MLQQTQIATALPYYDRWMARFPTIESLAEADVQDALALWQGLGYYRRCRMLVEGAKRIAESEMPTCRNEWLKVPGVGEYTAAAISSICYGEAASVVDGNVERVVSRLTCDDSTGSKLKANSWKWADEHLFEDEPGEWNQAVMELGATVCKPAVPVCQLCPITKSCLAFKTKRVTEYPRPKPKPTTIQKTEEIWIVVWSDRIGIVRDHKLDWWKGLSLLPFSTTHPHDFDALWKESLGEIKYTVTHHKITALVHLVRVEGSIDGIEWVSQNEIGAVPLPAPHRKALTLFYKT